MAGKTALVAHLVFRFPYLDFVVVDCDAVGSSPRIPVWTYGKWAISRKFSTMRSADARTVRRRKQQSAAVFLEFPACLGGFDRRTERRPDMAVKSLCRVFRSDATVGIVFNIRGSHRPFQR